MLKEKARHYYLDEKCNCAVSILKAANDEFGLDLGAKDIALLKGFGGGMGCGDVCGALAGSVAVLGALHANDEGFMDRVGDFVSRYQGKLSATDCKTIGALNKTPEERCVKTVEIAADMLDAELK